MLCFGHQLSECVDSCVLQVSSRRLKTDFATFLFDFQFKKCRAVHLKVDVLVLRFCADVYYDRPLILFLLLELWRRVF